MKRLLLITALTVAALLVPNSMRSVSSQTVEKKASAADSAPKFALLVGVNKYKDQPNKVSDLHGTHNDVALMKSLLLEYGFKEELKKPSDPATAPCGDQSPASGIKTLCSEQATKKGILDTFDSHLIGNAKAYWQGKTPDPVHGPSVVFYYSGHGSQVEDLRPIEGEKESDLIIDEPDGLDETIVAQDSDTNGIRDIRDDSFETRIAELKKYTQNITFISDSCHSGTITRGTGMKGFPREFPNLKIGASAAKGTEEAAGDAGYVTISGSLPNQYSYEDDVQPAPGAPTQKEGLLTYYFVNLVRNNPEVSYRDLTGLIRNAIVSKGKNQTPQAEGAIDRQVFGSAATTGKRAIALKCTGIGAEAVCSTKVEKKNADGTTSVLHRVTMDVGNIVGAREGGPIVIYSPKAKELTGDAEKIAIGTITYADAFSSEAEVTLSDAKRERVDPLSKVVLLAPNFSDAKRKVAIDLTAAAPDDAGKASMQKLVASLKDSTFITPVETNGLLRTFESKGVDAKANPWELAVVRGTYRDFKVGREASAAGAAKNSPPADDQQGYFIADKDGLAVYDQWVKADSPNAAAIIQETLEKHVKVANVRGLRNEASPLTGKVSVTMTPVKQFTPRAGNRCDIVPYSAAELLTPMSTPMIHRNQAYNLQIKNLSDKKLFLYLYSIDSSAQISLAYPPPGAQEVILPDGTWTANARNPCNLFAFGENDPTGVETIKVVVSENEFPAEMLTQTGISSTKDVRGGSSLLTKMLMQAGSNTRAAINGGAVGDWTTVDVNYNVLP